LRGSAKLEEIGAPASSGTAEDKFDEAVNDEADPGIDEQTPVETEGLVAGGLGQVGHQNEEVEEAAEDDGGELLEEAEEQFALEMSA
jgi:hypothetical protein